MKIIKELEKKTVVRYKILDSKHLLSKPLSIKLSYKHEINNFLKIVNHIKPDIFIVGNDQGFSATFIRICKLQGIPSIVVQDGILLERKFTRISVFLSQKRYLPWRIISTITENPVFSRLSLFLGRQWCVAGWGTGGANAIAVSGNYYKKVLI